MEAAVVDASWPGLAAAVRTGGIGALGNAMSATFASLRADEKLFLFGPAAMFWLCCSFWASVVACFPRHAKAHEVKGPPIKSPGVVRVLSYTLGYQAVMVVLQLLYWTAGEGRAPEVAGGFGSSAEWRRCALQFLPALLLQDFYLYWIHRWMHRPLPFRFIHKMHHTVHTPYACAAFYLHPIELTILDNGAAFVAAKLFPSMRFWTSTLLALVLPVRAVHEHLGYSFPWDADERVGTGKATHHAIHHMPKGHKYNYATPYFTFCDDLFGTRYPGDDKLRELRAKQT